MISLDVFDDIPDFDIERVVIEDDVYDFIRIQNDIISFLENTLFSEYKTNKHMLYGFMDKNPSYNKEEYRQRIEDILPLERGDLFEPRALKVNLYNVFAVPLAIDIADFEAHYMNNSVAEYTTLTRTLQKHFNNPYLTIEYNVYKGKYVYFIDIVKR